MLCTRSPTLIEGWRWNGRRGFCRRLLSTHGLQERRGSPKTGALVTLDPNGSLKAMETNTRSLLDSLAMALADDIEMLKAQTQLSYRDEPKSVVYLLEIQKKYIETREFLLDCLNHMAKTPSSERYKSILE
jgi:hypothetical protein